MDFYEMPSLVEGERKLKQGDILASVPFPAFSVMEALVLIPNADAPEKIDLTGNPNLPAKTQLLASFATSIGIVLNQSCDLTGLPKREKPILIARVAPCAEKIRGFNPGNMKDAVGKIKSLANPGKNPSLFYLPKYEDNDFRMPKSVADLLEVVCFPPNNLVAAFHLTTLSHLAD